jgi:hypothetical protein
MALVDEEELGDNVYDPIERFGKSWVWNDEWSTAEEGHNISLWEGALGTVLKGGHDTSPASSFGQLANTDASSSSGLKLARPVGFQRIWDDSGSVGKFQMSVWSVTPPDGYVAVGDVAVSHRDEPKIDSVWCVHSSQCEEVAYNVRWTEEPLESDAPCTLCTCDGAEGYMRASAERVEVIMGHQIIVGPAAAAEAAERADVAAAEEGGGASLVAAAGAEAGAGVAAEGGGS